MVEFVGEDRFESGAFEADIKAPGAGEKRNAYRLSISHSNLNLL